MFGELATVLAALLSTLFVMAALVEAVVEVAVSSWLWKGIEGKEDQRATALRLACAALGVVLAVVFGLDLFGVILGFLGVVPVYPQVAAIVGCVLTGVLFGRGSNWLHDLGKTLFGLDTPTGPSIDLLEMLSLADEDDAPIAGTGCAEG